MENQRTIDYCIKSCFYVASQARGGERMVKWETGLSCRTLTAVLASKLILAWK
jgi:hypothetical protein